MTYDVVSDGKNVKFSPTKEKFFILDEPDYADGNSWYFKGRSTTITD